MKSSGENADPFKGFDLPAARRSAWQYYRLDHIADDGYPICRAPLDETRLAAHPIHGAYLIIEYINEFLRRGRKVLDLLVAAEQVARAAIARMDRIDDTLRFMYRRSDGMTPYPFDFYSGLTQGRYLVALARLWQVTHSEFLLEEAKGILRSLTVPAEQGGVLKATSKGILIEEYPSEIPSYVLNGWMTVINDIFFYAHLTESRGAHRLATSSAETLASFLPLYDVPEELTSRYKLTGPVLHRLLFDRNSQVSVKSITVEAGESTVEKQAPLSELGYGTVQLLREPGEGNRYFSFRALASMATYPTSSSITIALTAATPTKMIWSVGIPQRNPRFPTPRAVGTRDIATHALVEGSNAISLQVPWDIGVAWAAVPTSFSKHVGNKYYNVYHPLHIRALSQLYEYFPSAQLRKWRDRWYAYLLRWPKHPPYLADDISLDIVPTDGAVNMSDLLEPRHRLSPAGDQSVEAPEPALDMADSEFDIPAE